MWKWIVRVNDQEEWKQADLNEMCEEAEADDWV